jgi:non-ribosomal peptide synthase protein (TIGR01720 family)
MTDPLYERNHLIAQKYAPYFAEHMVTGDMPLLPNCQYYLDMPDEDPQVFNISLLLETYQPLDDQLLAEATYIVLNQHDALRSRFTQTEHGWQVHIAPIDETIPFSQIDFSHVHPEQQKTDLEAEIERLQGTLDLSNGPLIRIVHFFLGNQQPGRLLFIVHHFVTDAFSQTILMEDFFTAYEQLRQGLPLNLQKKTSSVKEYVEHLSAYAHGDAMQEIELWVTEERAQAAPLPVDYPEGMNALLVADSVPLFLDEEETRALLSLSKYRISMRDILLACLGATYHAWTGESIMPVDYVYNGRITPFRDIYLTRTVGYLDYRIPLLIPADPTSDFGERVDSIKHLIQGLPNYGMGYHTLRYLGSKEVEELLASLPWPQLHFNYFGKTPNKRRSLPWLGQATEEIRGVQSKRRIDPKGFWIFIGIDDNILWSKWEYHAKIYKRETVEQLTQMFLLELKKSVRYYQENFS